MKKYKINFPNKEDILKTNKIAEELFGTDEDETQADPTLETALKLISVEKFNFICLKEKGEVIAWSVVLPTSKDGMDNFLNKEINEKQLFDLFLKKPSFEALYLTAVIVLPEYRNKGLGTFLMSEQVKYFRDNYGINNFYAMILSEGGEGVVRSLEEKFDVKVNCISRV